MARASFPWKYREKGSRKSGLKKGVVSAKGPFTRKYRGKSSRRNDLKRGVVIDQRFIYMEIERFQKKLSGKKKGWSWPRVIYTEI